MNMDNKNQRHEERMAKKKAVIDEKIKQADKEKGVIVITTGNGKGKSSSGFGMVARALGAWDESGYRAIHQGFFFNRRRKFLSSFS